MWRRPVGWSGSGPQNQNGQKVRLSDLDNTQLPGIKVVDGRQLSQEFIDEMVEARKNEPPPVNFVEQHRERKRNGTS